MTHFPLIFKQTSEQILKEDLSWHYCIGSSLESETAQSDKYLQGTGALSHSCKLGTHQEKINNGIFSPNMPNTIGNFKFNSYLILY